jgi:putative SbcD/Mre11-related phosphoesterase
MNYAVSELLTLDARRAAWMPQERVLAVADLHLGYAWAHRLAGQLMPVTPARDTASRLLELQRDYQPNKIVVLGDIVHRAVAIPALEEEIRELVQALGASSELVFLAGNHDRNLPQLLSQWLLPVQVAAFARAGCFLLVHGDEAVAKKDRARLRIMMGHEHPAIAIGDGVTTSQKCPCFLLGDQAIVLPAFSHWAAGTNVRTAGLMSSMARRTRFTEAVAICGDKLLPLRL